MKSVNVRIAALLTLTITNRVTARANQVSLSWEQKLKDVLLSYLV